MRGQGPQPLVDRVLLARPALPAKRGGQVSSFGCARASTRRRSPDRSRRLTRSVAAPASASAAAQADTSFCSSTASNSSVSSADSLPPRLAASAANFAFFSGEMRAETSGWRVVATLITSPCLTMTDAGLSCPQAHNNPIRSARRTVLKISLANPPSSPQPPKPSATPKVGAANAASSGNSAGRKDVRHAEHQTVMTSSTTFARLQLRSCQTFGTPKDQHARTWVHPEIEQISRTPRHAERWLARCFDSLGRTPSPGCSARRTLSALRCCRVTCMAMTAGLLSHSSRPDSSSS